MLKLLSSDRTALPNLLKLRQACPAKFLKIMDTDPSARRLMAKRSDMHTAMVKQLWDCFIGGEDAEGVADETKRVIQSVPSPMPNDAANGAEVVPEESPQHFLKQMCTAL